MPTPKALTPEALKCLCDANQFNFKTTKEIDPLTDVIGQQRAVQAIEFGLNMDAPGYHIFVTGLPGTGKSTIVQDIVGKHASQLEPASGWCLVNNFDDEYRPIPIETPSGRAVALTKGLGVVNRTQIGVSPLPLHEAILPLHDHSQVLVVQQQDLDRQILAVTCGQLLTVHLTASIPPTRKMLDDNSTSAAKTTALRGGKLDLGGGYHNRMRVGTSVAHGFF